MAGGERRRAAGARWRISLVLALLLAALATAFGPPAPVGATTRTVTNGNDSGAGSLRQTIADAVAGDTITFANGVTTVTLTTAQLSLTKNLTIQGSGVGGVTVTRSSAPATPDFRIFELDFSVSVTLQGLTISNGKTSANGGGINSNGDTLTLTDSVISGNSGQYGGGLYSRFTTTTLNNTTVGANTGTTGGGGIVNEFGATTLSNSVVSGNDAPFGGGLYNYSTGAVLSLTNGSVVSGNTATSGCCGGGGLYNQETLNVIDSTISGNTAASGSSGGGIANQSGTLTVTRSTISGNTASSGGGGIRMFNGTLTATNSTISGNTASGGGGGIEGNTPITLRGVTVTANSAGTSGGGGLSIFGSTTTLFGSVVAGNTASSNADCGKSGAAIFASEGYNVVGSGSDCPTTGTGDLAYTGALSALLNTALADNGGPTNTHALPSGSAAIDHVPTAQCGALNGTDQRGTARPQGSGCDSGAVEYIDGLQYYPLPAPVRLLETRAGQPVGCDKPGASLAALSTRTEPAATVCAGIPAAARAVVGNATVVPGNVGGYLTLFPSDVADPPTVASVNYGAGEVVNNHFTVGLGAGDGAFKLYAASATHVIIDVTGYYAPPGTGGLYYHPLPAPVRLLETRAGQPVGCDKPAASLAALSTRDQPATTPCTGIPAGARAVVGNATVVPGNVGGYLTLFPGGVADAPTVASVNYGPGQVVNTAFTVGLGAIDGDFQLYAASATHVIIDVTGYYDDVAADGLLFHPLPSPVRLLETRAGLPVGCDKPGASLAALSTRDEPATTPCSGVPAGARAIVGNATTVPGNVGGYVTLFPGGVANAPTVASVNYGPSQVVNNFFNVGLGAIDGDFQIYVASATHLIIDLTGFFAP